MSNHVVKFQDLPSAEEISASCDRVFLTNTVRSLQAESARLKGMIQVVAAAHASAATPVPESYGLLVARRGEVTSLVQVAEHRCGQIVGAERRKLVEQAKILQGLKAALYADVNTRMTKLLSVRYPAIFNKLKDEVHALMREEEEALRGSAPILPQPDSTGS